MMYMVAYETPCGDTIPSHVLTNDPHPTFYIDNQSALKALDKIRGMKEWDSPDRFKIISIYSSN